MTQTTPFPVSPGIASSEFKVVMGIPSLDAMLAAFMDAPLPEHWRMLAYGLAAVYVAGRSFVKGKAVQGGVHVTNLGGN